METSVKERLIKYLSYKGISKSEFGRRIGVSNAFVTSIKNSISPEKLQAIGNTFPDLDIQWLVTGSGTMLKDPYTVNGDGNVVNSQNFSYEGTTAELIRIIKDQQAQIGKLIDTIADLSRKIKT